MSDIEEIGRVLIVDDDPQTRSVLARILSADGFAVTVVGDGDAALSLLPAHPPDLILLDVILPGRNGFEICHAIKSDPATRLTPVVLMTGMHDRQRRLEGIAAGADDFLTKPFDVEELRVRARSLLRIKRYTDDLDSAESAMIALAQTIEARDSSTQGHCQRLSRYAVTLGAAMHLGGDELRALERGGHLHDIGKVAVPDAILRKPAPLSFDEYEVMKQHTVIGDRLLRGLRVLRLVRPIVRHHHERRDGSGYPDALRGDEVPLLAEIVGMVDVFDALTTVRPYRQPLSYESAGAELSEQAHQGLWRPALFKAFNESILQAS
jgi:putative two-component system response regulator